MFMFVYTVVLIIVIVATGLAARRGNGHGWTAPVEQKSRVDYAKIERLERELFPHLHPDPPTLPGRTPVLVPGGGLLEPDVLRTMDGRVVRSSKSRSRRSPTMGEMYAKFYEEEEKWQEDLDPRRD